MIINDKSAAERLNSPTNLINRLKNTPNVRKSAMSLFIPSKREEKEVSSVSGSQSILPAITGETHLDKNTQSFNPFIKSLPSSSNSSSSSKDEAQPSLDKILEDHESQIKLGLAHDRSLNLLSKSVELLTDKLDDIKPDKLPSVISAASKVVESIRKERIEQSKNSKDREVHFHFYTPQQKQVSDYEVIDVA